MAINKYLADYKNKGDKEVDEVLLSYYIKKNDRTEIAKLIASDPKDTRRNSQLKQLSSMLRARLATNETLRKQKNFIVKGSPQTFRKLIVA